MGKEEMKYILWFEDCDPDSFSLVGGKNANLGVMMQAGIRVPPGFAVTTEAYKTFILGRGIWEKIQLLLANLDPQDIATLAETGAAIRHLITSAEAPKALVDEIRGSYQALSERCAMEDIPVAVRSSATAEDLPGASFAGQQDSFLWVRGADAVVESTLKCWASLFTDRAISYRAKMGFPTARVKISVGIQKMVNARTAGIMFTVDPVTGNRSKIVIEANWGLGESIVQGMIAPDRYIVDKDTQDIQKEIGVKTRKVVPVESGVLSPALNKAGGLSNGGTSLEVVPPGERLIPCLTREEVQQLAELARAVENHYGSPQDTEWAIDYDLTFPENIFMLQSRPVTVMGPKIADEYVKEDGKSTTDHIIDLMLKKGFGR
jgi:pyruvate,water dikinase